MQSKAKVHPPDRRVGRLKEECCTGGMAQVVESLPSKCEALS
jgi:hypothetical protein